MSEQVDVPSPDAAKLASFWDRSGRYQLGAGYFVVKPANGATWKVRAASTILLPKKK